MLPKQDSPNTTGAAQASRPLVARGVVIGVLAAGLLFTLIASYSNLTVRRRSVDGAYSGTTSGAVPIGVLPNGQVGAVSAPTDRSDYPHIIVTRVVTGWSWSLPLLDLSLDSASVRWSVQISCPDPSLSVKAPLDSDLTGWAKILRDTNASVDYASHYHDLGSRMRDETVGRTAAVYIWIVGGVLVIALAELITLVVRRHRQTLHQQAEAS